MGKNTRAQWRTIQHTIRRIIQAVDKRQKQSADCIFLYVNIYFQ